MLQGVACCRTLVFCCLDTLVLNESLFLETAPRFATEISIKFRKNKLIASLAHPE